jgi:hypothetical protein
MAATVANPTSKLAWMAVAVYLIGFGISAAIRSQSDFTIYRNAGLAAAAGRPIYDAGDWSPFQYAPIYAIFFVPFGVISSRMAQLLWFAISMAGALPAMILGTCRMLQGPDVELSAEMIAVPLLLIARFLHPNFDHGQINLVVVAMIVWGLVFARESKPILAGFLLAASLLIKPFALPAMVYLLFRKRYSVIISAAIFIIALLCLPGLFLGIGPAFSQTFGYFVSLLTRVPLSRLAHDLRSAYDQSPSAIAVRLLASPKHGIKIMNQATAAGFGLTLNLALLGSTIWRLYDTGNENPAADSLRTAAVFCFIPSCLPLSWLEYYVALAIPYAALVAELSAPDLEKGRARVIYVTLAVTFVLNVVSRFFGEILYLGGPYFCSLAILSTILASKRLAPSRILTAEADPAWAS